MAIQKRFTTEDMGSPELAAALQEKSGQLQKITTPSVDLKKAQEETALQVVLQVMRDLEKRVSSVQDLLLEVAANMNQASPPQQSSEPAPAIKRAVTPEELSAVRRNAAAKALAARVNSKVALIKAFQKANPGASLSSISAGTRVGLATLVKYQERGLI